MDTLNNNNFIKEVFPHPADLFPAVAEDFAQRAIAAVAAKGEFTVVLSGGVFQNELLLRDIRSLLEPQHLRIWTNHIVPANDGGISLGQAALAAFANLPGSVGSEEMDSASLAHVT